jgi:hypothetical protein
MNGGTHALKAVSFKSLIGVAFGVGLSRWDRRAHYGSKVQNSNVFVFYVKQCCFLTKMVEKKATPH